MAVLLKVVLDVVATITADLEPVRGFSSFLKKKSHFFWRVDTPLQVFPVHTPVRRGQSGTLSQVIMVPGQLRRDFALTEHKSRHGSRCKETHAVGSCFKNQKIRSRSVTRGKKR